MSPNLSVEGEWFISKKGGKCGLPSSTRGYPTSAIGEGLLITMTGSVLCGLKAKGYYLSAKQFGPFMRATQVFKPKSNVVHVLGFYNDRKSKHSTARYKPEVRNHVPPNVIPMTEPFATSFASDRVDLESLDLVEEVIAPQNSNSNVGTAGMHPIAPSISGQANIIDPFFQQLLDIDCGLQKFQDHGIQTDENPGNTVKEI